MIFRGEKNSYTSYIKLQNLVNVDQFHLQFQNLDQIGYMEIQVFGYCPFKKMFLPVKWKYFDGNYFNQLMMNKELNQEFFINTFQDKPFLLYKLVVILNHIPIYEYTNQAQLSFKVRLFGRRAFKEPTEEQKHLLVHIEELVSHKFDELMNSSDK